jgi:hypothetical protein
MLYPALGKVRLWNHGKPIRESTQKGEQEAHCSNLQKLLFQKKWFLT